MLNILKRILVGFLAYAVVLPFVMGVAVMELIMAIIYILRYVAGVLGLSVLYAMGYIFPDVLHTLPFNDKRMVWPTYKYVVEQDFRQCLQDIRSMSTFIN